MQGTLKSIVLRFLRGLPSRNRTGCTFWEGDLCSTAFLDDLGFSSAFLDFGGAGRRVTVVADFLLSVGLSLERERDRARGAALVVFCLDVLSCGCGFVVASFVWEGV